MRYLFSARTLHFAPAASAALLLLTASCTLLPSWLPSVGWGERVVVMV